MRIEIPKFKKQNKEPTIGEYWNKPARTFRVPKFLRNLFFIFGVVTLLLFVVLGTIGLTILVGAHSVPLGILIACFGLALLIALIDALVEWTI